MYRGINSLRTEYPAKKASCVACPRATFLNSVTTYVKEVVAGRKGRLGPLFQKAESSRWRRCGSGMHDRACHRGIRKHRNLTGLDRNQRFHVPKVP